MRYFILAIGLALVMPATSEAQAAVWKDDVRGWFIGVDRSLGDGCYMHSEFDGGGTMRVGFGPNEQKILVIIGNDTWRSLEEGKIYPIEFQFGSRSPWTVEAGVFRWDDGEKSLQFGVPFGDDRAELFINELQQMQDVSVRYEGRQILRLSLRGSFAAMAEVIDCQVNMQQGRGGSSDPFSSGPGSDPFR